MRHVCATLGRAAAGVKFRNIQLRNTTGNWDDLGRRLRVWYEGKLVRVGSPPWAGGAALKKVSASMQRHLGSNRTAATLASRDFSQHLRRVNSGAGRPAQHKGCRRKRGWLRSYHDILQHLLDILRRVQSSVRWPAPKTYDMGCIRVIFCSADTQTSCFLLVERVLLPSLFALSYLDFPMISCMGTSCRLLLWSSFSRLDCRSFGAVGLCAQRTLSKCAYPLPMLCFHGVIL